MWCVCVDARWKNREIEFACFCVESNVCGSNDSLLNKFLDDLFDFDSRTSCLTLIMIELVEAITRKHEIKLWFSRM